MIRSMRRRARARALTCRYRVATTAIASAPASSKPSVSHPRGWTVEVWAASWTTRFIGVRFLRHYTARRRSARRFIYGDDAGLWPSADDASAFHARQVSWRHARDARGARVTVAAIAGASVRAGAVAQNRSSGRSGHRHFWQTRLTSCLCLPELGCGDQVGEILDQASDQPCAQRALNPQCRRDHRPARSGRQPNRDDRIVFLGPDQDDTMLEVMAVETEAGLLVIHVMRIRPKHLEYLEGARDEED